MYVCLLPMVITHVNAVAAILHRTGASVSVMDAQCLSFIKPTDLHTVFNTCSCDKGHMFWHVLLFIVGLTVVDILN